MEIEQIQEVAFNLFIAGYLAVFLIMLLGL